MVLCDVMEFMRTTSIHFKWASSKIRYMCPRKRTSEVVYSMAVVGYLTSGQGYRITPHTVTPAEVLFGRPQLDLPFPDISQKIR